MAFIVPSAILEIHIADLTIVEPDTIFFVVVPSGVLHDAVSDNLLRFGLGWPLCLPTVGGGLSQDVLLVCIGVYTLKARC